MENKTIRYCKKCGCELSMSTQFDKCEGCRNKSANKWRNAAKVVGGGLLVVITFIPRILRGKNK